MLQKQWNGGFFKSGSWIILQCDSHNIMWCSSCTRAAIIWKLGCRTRKRHSSMVFFFFWEFFFFGEGRGGCHGKETTSTKQSKTGHTKDTDTQSWQCKSTTIDLRKIPSVQAFPMVSCPSNWESFQVNSLLHPLIHCFRSIAVYILAQALIHLNFFIFSWSFNQH